MRGMTLRRSRKAFTRACGVVATGWVLVSAPITSAATPDSALLPAALAHANVYTWGLVGTPGAISSEEAAARELARHWNAAQLLAALPAASVEGRLYLLCIVNRLHPARYAQAKQAADLSPTQQASIFSGSVLRRVPAQDVIQQFERSRCEPLAWPIDLPASGPRR